MISNRESTRKYVKTILTAWVIIYLDKTILVLTLLRPSSSVRVVCKSLGPVCGPTEYFLFLLGPPFRTAFPDLLSGQPSGPSTLPSTRVLFLHPEYLLFLFGPPLLGASHPTPSTSAPSQRSVGPPRSGVMMTSPGLPTCMTQSQFLFRPPHPPLALLVSAFTRLASTLQFSVFHPYPCPSAPQSIFSVAASQKWITTATVPVTVGLKPIPVGTATVVLSGTPPYLLLCDGIAFLDFLAFRCTINTTASISVFLVSS
jgi:hypothetical protein